MCLSLGSVCGRCANWEYLMVNDRAMVGDRVAVRVNVMVRDGVVVRVMVKTFNT
jgi:hypothetical protein